MSTDWVFTHNRRRGTGKSAQRGEAGLVGLGLIPYINIHDKINRMILFIQIDW